ncbi:hypothetical protein DFP93_102145 [Aneurinibacillus soli]|uniref:Uncharacterized protein n=1 Tax=Aneurinibacillus soli TaxID=1500254 RepID=A0A0U5BBM5_9BACL|nr:hypothetical protein [Aneurinibacillus soli]PYE63461.1 hypothetical protein DFP93_102145 [Aneurinibacillus soli]BAU27607.1 hypothetical protein CB4_01781 [Aneurinibacillus soli]
MEEQKGMETSGFVVLPRLSIRNLRDKLLFYHLLEKADWNTGVARINVSELGRETGWSRKEIDNSLSRLQKSGVIQTETLKGKRGVRIELVHYFDYQNLSKYKKTAQANGKMAQAEEQANEEMAQASNNENPCPAWDSLANKSEVAQADEEMVQAMAQASEEKGKPLFINSIINSNSNSNKNNKPNTSLAPEKKQLASEADTISFVDENIDVLPSGVSKKLLIKYCETIRLTRNTCKVASSVLLQVFVKMKKYTSNQINYAVWNHAEKHDDKREKYTLGILRNTSNDEAYRKLMLMLNRQNQDDLKIEKTKEDVLHAGSRELDPALRDELNALSH